MTRSRWRRWRSKLRPIRLSGSCVSFACTLEDWRPDRMCSTPRPEIRNASGASCVCMPTSVRKSRKCLLGKSPQPLGSRTSLRATRCVIPHVRFYSSLLRSPNRSSRLPLSRRRKLIKRRWAWRSQSSRKRILHSVCGRTRKRIKP